MGSNNDKLVTVRVTEEELGRTSYGDIPLEIAVEWARRILAAAEESGEAKAPARPATLLCSSCDGSTVHKIPGGVRTCARCDGIGWEPAQAPPPPTPSPLAKRLREVAGTLFSIEGRGYLDAIDRKAIYVGRHELTAIAALSAQLDNHKGEL